VKRAEEGAGAAEDLVPEGDRRGREDRVPSTAAPEALDDDLIRRLTFRWSDLPPLTAELPGTGGSLRQERDDFVVRELPLYLPEGSGSHTYVRVEKVGLTTRDLVMALVAEGIPERSIGVAGLKDKHARTEQWLSVPRRFEGAVDVLESLDGVAVLEVSRHRNKLGIGHLRGNRFGIVVRGVTADAAERAEAVRAVLAVQGVPNYFGPQRFGRFGRNAVDGALAVRGTRVPGGRVLTRFFVGALQSQLFNALLAERVRDGTFGTVLRGDWARKHDTGGTFEVDDAALEAPRAAALAISATLPLHGTRVRVSAHEAGERERAALADLGLTWEDLAGRRHDGRRTRHAGRRGDPRLARLVGLEIEVEQDGDALRLAFDLPKGSYATTVVREITKVEVDAPEGASEDEPDAG
jgi:tRNA pseudouridine13 synthase